jgi:hypothetical protein
MELLLNILWVLLAVPAVLVWMRTPEQRLSSKRGLCSLFVLGCALLLLFPVISASDDLHAMRPEIEESTASKKIAIHVVAPHASAAWGLACAVTALPVTPQVHVCGNVIDFSIALPQEAAPTPLGARAPPVSLS